MILHTIVWSFLGVAAWAISLGFICLLMAACKEQDLQQSRAIDEHLRTLNQVRTSRHQQRTRTVEIFSQSPPSTTLTGTRLPISSSREVSVMSTGCRFCESESHSYRDGL